MPFVDSNLGCCSWMVFGALAGWLASLITGRNNRQGCIMNIVVGVIGAMIGGAVFGLITGGELEVGWSLTAFIVAVLGAVALLAIVNLFTRRR